jgi:hypothetical protein
MLMKLTQVVDVAMEKKEKDRKYKDYLFPGQPKSIKGEVEWSRIVLVVKKIKDKPFLLKNKLAKRINFIKSHFIKEELEWKRLEWFCLNNRKHIVDLIC